MTKERDIEHESTDDAVCPYCGTDQMDSHELGGHHHDTGSADCDECGKRFKWERETTITYTTAKL